MEETKKYILRIFYSWGDEEPDMEFESREEAWEKAKELAIKEAEITSIEHDTHVPLSFSEEEDVSKITLDYEYDATSCTYMVAAKDDLKSKEDFDGDFKEGISGLHFVWGITGNDNEITNDTGFYTSNEIDIFYEEKTKLYHLGIETAYLFKDFAAECDYLNHLLKLFTAYMDKNGLQKDKQATIFFGTPTITDKAESIEELYTNFKIFVDGFCAQKPISDISCSKGTDRPGKE